MKRTKIVCGNTVQFANVNEANVAIKFRIMLRHVVNRFGGLTSTVIDELYDSSQIATAVSTLRFSRDLFEAVTVVPEYGSRAVIVLDAAVLEHLGPDGVGELVQVSVDAALSRPSDADARDGLVS